MWVKSRGEGCLSLVKDLWMGGVVAKIVFKSGDEEVAAANESLLDIEIMNIDGDMVRLRDIAHGKKALLFVNVATK